MDGNLFFALSECRCSPKAVSTQLAVLRVHPKSLTLWPQPLFLHGSSLSLLLSRSLSLFLCCCFDISLVWDKFCVWNDTSSVFFQCIFSSLHSSIIVLIEKVVFYPPPNTLVASRSNTPRLSLLHTPGALFRVGFLALFPAFSVGQSRSPSSRSSAGLSHCSYFFGSALFSQAQRNCLFPWSTLTPGACPTS